MTITVSAPQSLLSPQAIEVLERRYLRKDADGNLAETPEELFRRVANAVSIGEAKYGATPTEVDEWSNRFFQLLWSLDFLPNSPTLMNAGTGAGTLSGCYVLSIADTMEDIMKAATDQAMIEKYGGGIGFSLSELRPAGTPIRTTQGHACGPLGVLRMLSSVGTMITQGGKRDGAHMAVMEVYHPDIMDFITCKDSEGDIHNFNISVGADSTFMRAVADDGYIHLTWPVDRTYYTKRSEGGFRMANRTDTIVEDDGKFISATDLFSKIVYGAWRNGEPGMIWLDRINRDNTTPHLGRITATNPCGEQPLLSQESCNLGSINLGHFVLSDGQFDMNRFSEIVRLSVRFLDNVVAVNAHPTPDTLEFNGRTRKIGLGVMGWADALSRMGIPYDSDEAERLAFRIGDMLKQEADDMSYELGRDKGDFPAFEESPWNLKNGGTWEHMRNAWRLSIAPTGTISMIAGCSSGIEPHFARSYVKKNMSAAMEGVELSYVNEDLRQRFEERGVHLNGSSDVESFVSSEDIRLFPTSSEVAPLNHVRMQAAWQTVVDSGISKTINLPNSATEKDIWDIYESAWKQSCKGITVYRSGSREKEVLVAVNAEPSEELPTPKTYKRPRRLYGRTDQITTGHGNLYVSVNSDGGRTVEVVSSLGKAGGCEAANIEAIGRLLSTALQYNVPSDVLITKMRGLSCCPAWHDGTMIRSPADGIAFALSQVESAVPLQVDDAPPDLDFEGTTIYNTGESCPECDSPATMSEGCLTCWYCGYSRCS